MIRKIVMGWIMAVVLLTVTGYSQESKDLEVSFPHVKEVVVFKNGFAYVRCEGEAAPVNGRIIIGEIPDASLGAFWGASLTGGIVLKSIEAREVHLLRQQTISDIQGLIRLNAGRNVTISTAVGKTITGILVGFQIAEIPDEKLEQPNPQEFYRRYGYYPSTQSSPSRTAPQMDWVTLKTNTGILALRTGEISTISFEEPESTVTENLAWKKKQLVLTFDGDTKKVAQPVTFTLFFILKGIRWIPDYKIELTETNTADLKLSATLLNEALDIKEATVRLMIGYPRFVFGESITPLTLREARRQLSAFFRPPTRVDAMANVLQSQSCLREINDSLELPEESPVAGEGVPIEDFFGYDLKKMTLPKGNVALVPVAESKHPVEHLYELDTWSFRPLLKKGNVPGEILEKVLMPDWDRVWHKLSIKNPVDAPITTAAATVFEKGQPLAQEMIKYAPPKGETVMPMTIAVDVLSSINESEIERKHNALSAMDRSWDLVTQKGKIILTNKKKVPVNVIVKRHLPGKVLETSGKGKADASSQGWEEFIMKLWEGSSRQNYWNWWGYYGDYPSVNPVSFVRWDLSLKPDEKITLDYTYSYYEYR